MAQVFTYRGATFKVEEGESHVYRFDASHQVYRKLTNNELLVYPRVSKLWHWLREQGIRRPAPSGTPGGQTPHKDRQAGGRVRIEVYLSPEAGKALDRLSARYPDRRSAVEAAILAADGAEGKR